MNKRLRHLLLPVAGTAVLLAACTSEAPWHFTTDYMDVTVDGHGYITGLKNTTVGNATELSPADKPSPLLTLYNSTDSTWHYPAEASYSRLSKVMTLKYDDGMEAEVKIEPCGKYLRMELVDLKAPEGIDAAQWGSVHTNITNLLGEVIGVARDTSDVANYAVGMLALDDNTLGCTADLDADAAPFEYIIHTPDPVRFPLPDSLYEGQRFSLGGNGISDVAFYAHKEPYYRIMYGNAATVDSLGRISIQYSTRDRSRRRTIAYSLIPHMEANIPNHIEVEPIEGVGVIGSKVALWGSPDSTALMDVIQDIVIKEGLPHPTINGKWIKDPTAYKPDVMVRGTEYDSIIDYTAGMGYAAIYAYNQFLHPDRANGGYVDGPGHEKKPFKLKSGDLSHKEFADKAADKGVLLGRVTITNSMAPGTSDVVPVPSDSICYQLRRALAADISATDTVIRVDNPLYMDEIGSWEGHCQSLNIIKIGKELIHYLGVSGDTLLNVTRGYWGTTPSAHKAGDVLDKTQVTINYGYDGLIPNMALQDLMADNYGQMAANSGITHFDLDGQEFLFNQGHGYYSVKRFMRRMFKKAVELGVPYLRVGGATLSEGSWHYQSFWNVGGGKAMYDIDTREWGSATSEGKDIRDVAYANYFPATFGSNFEIGPDSKVEDYNHVEATSIGHGAIYYMPMSPSVIGSAPNRDEIIATIATWERARSANAFPRSVRREMMNPAYDWTIEETDGGKAWLLHRKGGNRPDHTYKLKPSSSIPTL